MVNDKKNSTYDEFLRFAAKLIDIFDLDWGKYHPRIDAAYDFLQHIPEIAFRGMYPIAVDSWNGWPRNFPRAVKEVYETWRHQNQQVAAHSLAPCDYCNGHGFFTGIKRVEVKPGVRISFRFTFRCSACSNWRGVFGEKIPAAWPLELKTHGYELDIYPKPYEPAPPPAVKQPGSLPRRAYQSPYVD
jgi:hypothetical protein